MSKKTKRSISTFAILLAVMLLVSIATWLAAGKTYTGDNGEMAEVVGRLRQRHLYGACQRLCRRL